MRALGLMLLVACGGGPPAAVVPHEPINREGTVEYTLVPADGDARTVQRAAILRELDRVDRELDAIDDELAASAIAGPATRDAAIATITKRIAALQRTAPDTLFEDTPGLLVRSANAYFAARDRDVELSKDLGERHPERIEQRRVVEMLRASFDRQREVEIVVATAWRDEVTKLPKQASAAKIRQANRRAVQSTLARAPQSDAIVPNDAPAEVRLAAARVAAAYQRIEAASPALGPKHPDMIEMQDELVAARTGLRDAIAVADAAIEREITGLDTPRPPPVVDPARLARRAELATRARDLRREWDALR